MLSTVATGGFSVYEDSIAHYGSLTVYWVVAFFMFVGGVGFQCRCSLPQGNSGAPFKIRS